MYDLATGDDPVEKANEGMKYFLLKLMLCHKFDNDMMYVCLVIIPYCTQINSNLDQPTNKLSQMRSHVIQQMTLNMMMSYQIAVPLIIVTILLVHIIS